MPRPAIGGEGGVRYYSQLPHVHSLDLARQGIADTGIPTLISVHDRVLAIIICPGTFFVTNYTKLEWDLCVL